MLQFLTILFSAATVALMSVGVTQYIKAKDEENELDEIQEEEYTEEAETLMGEFGSPVVVPDPVYHTPIVNGIALGGTVELDLAQLSKGIKQNLIDRANEQRAPLATTRPTIEVKAAIRYCASVVHQLEKAGLYSSEAYKVFLVDWKKAQANNRKSNEKIFQEWIDAAKKEAGAIQKAIAGDINPLLSSVQQHLTDFFHFVNSQDAQAASQEFHQVFVTIAKHYGLPPTSLNVYLSHLALEDRKAFISRGGGFPMEYPPYSWAFYVATLYARALGAMKQQGYPVTSLLKKEGLWDGNLQKAYGLGLFNRVFSNNVESLKNRTKMGYWVQEAFQPLDFTLDLVKDREIDLDGFSEAYWEVIDAKHTNPLLWFDLNGEDLLHMKKKAGFSKDKALLRLVFGFDPDARDGLATSSKYWEVNYMLPIEKENSWLVSKPDPRKERNQ